MLFRTVIGLALFLSPGTLSLSTGAATAGQKIQTQNSLASASPMFRDLALSRNLISYGRRNRDAMAMIVAADMRKKLELKPAQQPKLKTDFTNSETDRNDENSISAILSDAEKFAANNETYLELIKDIRLTREKGNISGPSYKIRMIKAGEEIHYQDFRFEEKSYAEIYVEGSGNTNLDLYIYDTMGRLVCSDADASNINYCGWTPGSSDAYKITIVNKGTKTSRFSLISN